MISLPFQRRIRAGSLGTSWNAFLHHNPTTRGFFTSSSSISSQALERAAAFDERYGIPSWTSHDLPTVHRDPVIPYPLSPYKDVPLAIPRPPYAETGIVPSSPWNDHTVLVWDDPDGIHRMRCAARLARRVLDMACNMARPGISTDEIDTAVHHAIIQAGAYPSPLNYAGFPKSLCTSINEVICHGIPDQRLLQLGDVVSFDVSCFLNGVHGDNCATVVVGDHPDSIDDNDDKKNDSKNQSNQRIVGTDWRGVPFKAQFDNPEQEMAFWNARRLVHATRESLYAAIETCRPGSCLTQVGAAVQDVADAYGYSTVEKYRGHGIGTEFHRPPFVKHYRNNDKLELVPGMIFTIEPMLTEGAAECFEWADEWTVATVDGGLAAQFEHTVLITESGVEILTLPE